VAQGLLSQLLLLKNNPIYAILYETKASPAFCSALAHLYNTVHQTMLQIRSKKLWPSCNKPGLAGEAKECCLRQNRMLIY
jgi:hypothetical protein